LDGFFTEETSTGKLVRRYLEKHSGRVIRRQRIERVLYGQEKPDLVMVIDFPDRALAEGVFFEQEYLDIIPLHPPPRVGPTLLDQRLGGKAKL
jgi:hypothetical protein